MRNNNKPSTGFTLAEVLITLGIIGVVAALVMPSLIENYQKKAAALKVKKFYSQLSQAIKLSEAHNGPVEDWDLPLNYGDNAIPFYNKYLADYLKTTRVTHTKNASGQTVCILADLLDGGSMSICGNSGVVFCYYPKYTDKNPVAFIFELKSSHGYFKDYLLHPRSHVSAGVPWNGTRQNLADNCTQTNYHGCTMLLQYDDWEIKNDYYGKWK